MNKNLHNISDLETIQKLKDLSIKDLERIAELEAEVERLSILLDSAREFLPKDTYVLGGKLRRRVNPSGQSLSSEKGDTKDVKLGPLTLHFVRKERDDG